VEIHGDAIALRELSPADAAAAFEWGGDKRFFEYMTVEPVASVADEEALLRDWEAESRAVPRRQYRLGIVELDTSTLVGTVRLGIVNPEQREADLGYGLRPDRWGRGITVAAAALLLDVAFADLGLHRVFAYHDPANRASRRVMEKLGMTYEGTLRQNMLGRDGWRDSALWAVLEDEWRAGH
jgi:[ribosomal protein S5]-alanine N-acetyltransferase